jgi:hypothetical protein
VSLSDVSNVHKNQNLCTLKATPKRNTMDSKLEEVDGDVMMGGQSDDNFEQTMDVPRFSTIGPSGKLVSNIDVPQSNPFRGDKFYIPSWYPKYYDEVFDLRKDWSLISVTGSPGMVLILLVH